MGRGRGPGFLNDQRSGKMEILNDQRSGKMDVYLGILLILVWEIIFVVHK